MAFTEEFSTFTFQMVSQIPHSAGVFELANPKREVIYIGKAEDLKNDLLGIFGSYNPCFTAVKYYRIEMNPEIDAAYRRLFRAYKEDHNERLPKCNDSDPTLMDSYYNG